MHLDGDLVEGLGGLGRSSSAPRLNLLPLCVHGCRALAFLLRFAILASSRLQLSSQRHMAGCVTLAIAFSSFSSSLASFARRFCTGMVTAQTSANSSAADTRVNIVSEHLLCIVCLVVQVKLLIQPVMV